MFDTEIGVWIYSCGVGQALICCSEKAIECELNHRNSNLDYKKFYNKLSYK